jgi:hypothetical protein
MSLMILWHWVNLKFLHMRKRLGLLCLNVFHEARKTERGGHFTTGRGRAGSIHICCLSWTLLMSRGIDFKIAPQQFRVKLEVSAPLLTQELASVHLLWHRKWEGKMHFKAHTSEASKLPLANPGKSRIPKMKGNHTGSDFISFPHCEVTWKSCDSVPVSSP